MVKLLNLTFSIHTGKKPVLAVTEEDHHDILSEKLELYQCTNSSWYSFCYTIASTRKRELKLEPAIIL